MSQAGEPDHIGEYPLVKRNKAPATDSVLLYGPPGTGKTTQIKRRLHEVFEKTDRGLSDYTIVVYRKAMAKELIREFNTEGWIKENELKRKSRGRTRQIGTIHALAKRQAEDKLAASQFREQFGSDNPDVAGQYQVGQFFESLGIRYCPYASQSEAGDLLERVWSWSRQNWPLYYGKRESFRELDADEKYSLMQKCPQWSDLTREFDGHPVSVYSKYRKYLRENGLMDFDDMISACLDQDLTPSTQGLVVDEAHDLTPLLMRLVTKWAAEAEHVIIAGDRDQVINHFDGARRELYEQLADKLGLEELLLNKSHRLSPQAWELAQSLLSKAHSPPDVEPVSDSNFTIETVESPLFDPSWRGNTWLDGSFPTNEENSPIDIIDFEDITQTGRSAMFLTRTKLQIKGIMSSLDEVGVPYETQSGLRGWLTEINAGYYPNPRRLDIYNVCQKLSSIDPKSVTSWAMVDDPGGEKDACDVCLDPREMAVVGSFLKEEYATESRSDLRDRARMTDSPKDCSTLPLNREGWMKVTSSPRQALTAFTEGWYRIEREKNGVLSGFERFDTPITEAIARSITMETIHASKGDEADHVVLYDGVTSKVQNEGFSGDDYRSRRVRENEWRTWYVGTSRSSEKLSIVRGAWGMDTMPMIDDDLISRIQKTSNPESNRGDAE